jgi:preprotein translocase subunit YajC
MGTVLALNIIFILSGTLIILARKRKKQKAEMERLKALPIEEKKLALMKLQGKVNEFKTNHLLHFFLTVFMAGLWIIPWFFIAQSNAARRKEVESLIDAI